MDWSFNISVVLTGIVIVFIVLILLVILVKIVGGFFTLTRSKPNTQPATIPPKPAEFNSMPNLANAQTNDSDDEIIAVISAAIYSVVSSDRNITGIHIDNITPCDNKSNSITVNKTFYSSDWSHAGVINNTKPF